MEWDDLRYVLAVADGGSLASAARALHVDRTTVLRRIASLERNQGVRLFERVVSL
jgi:DNA-binding transcriptional LysR family regulator